MNKPISRFPCGDMGLQAGGGHNSDPMPGFWNGADGDLSIDAVGPVRIAGRTGSGYALHTNRDPYPDPYDPNAAGVYAGDNFPVNHNRGLETVGVGDPEVDYFLPTGFVIRAYLSIDRFPVIGDISYDGSFNKAGSIFSIFSTVVGVDHEGRVWLWNSGTWVATDTIVGLNEYHLYELYIEFQSAPVSPATTTLSTRALRVDEGTPVKLCISSTTSTYPSTNLRAQFISYSTGISVDDVGIDAITQHVGNWIGPGECEIVRPTAAVSRPTQSWASGTDYSPENGDPAYPSDPAHPQCTPGVHADWYESIASEIPYRPVNYGAEDGFIGGSGADFAIGYAMSNPGADPIPWEDATRATCRSARRGASGEMLMMTLDTPGFSPNFSRTFVYASRTERINNRDDSTGSEKLISGLAVNMGYAAVYNFGMHSAGDNRWALSTQYRDSDATDLTMVIRREINLPNVGVSVYAAGSQTAIDSNPGPALPSCTPPTATARPIICFV